MLGESFLGKYAALFAYEECPPSVETPELTEIIDLEKLPKQLCQHIIGIIYKFRFIIKITVTLSSPDRRNESQNH